MTRAIGFRGVQQGPAERSRDFRGTAIRMVKRLAPQRFLTATVITLSMIGIAIGVIGPRILGHATDLLFNGVIGRQLPAGQSREQAVETARARGDGQFAQMLSGMNVIPGQGVDFHAIGMTLALALSLYLIAGMLAWVQARLLNVTVQRTVVALRTEVENKIHRLPLSYFDSRQRGEILSRVTNDVDNIQTSLQMSINQLLSSMLTLVAVLAMMLSISPLLAVITLATVPLSLWVTRTIARRSQRLFVAQWANTGKLNAHIEETYSGFTIVKTYGHRAEAEAIFADRNAEVYRSAFGAQFFSGLVSPATAFVGNLSYVAVAVVGGLKVASGGLTLGSIQAFSQYVRQFNQPLTQVAAMYNTLQSGLASAERVFELLDADEETPDPLAAATAPTGSVRVEFEDISFGYSPGQPVIEGLSLRVEPGQTVAIVGPTGAGKTTLVNLLMRFYEVDSGRILLDGIDVSTMTRHDLRSRMGMVLQDTWLFGGTIAENIAYGRPGASQEEILEAARAAYVDRFVRTLPDGYDTKIADDGGNISAGEKQLITIARAFLARPQLLILDEATSSVDTRTELRIQRAMAELRRDRTSFIIAHRLSTIRDADRIVVLDGGRVTESGTHTELLARHGAYFAMTQS
ncbi:ABC transporter ATP-binding protein [Mycobacteroides abscessus]|uniref:ABC transporter ATP-binding protein n=1 Tax=Mycobacteroides abscessus TaxID=36809 RepID=UPI00026834FD|nr:ABC transporter ATP-binding protein [Mycobacteroides abscessus]EIT99011.1 multidrug resistance ABC transporter ATP-binding and permease protein [Mycobacteroides abscessus 4S-0726-RA]EIT99729.1 multidrug resistance ABC transporter ATP-binding and permease protein [Mycobacteroides abscessus 4S-0303]EIU02222.1 multidrug resistance ABC transporter ATP-binding and permease protein [Mycobacteroides abscessus 4S-0726-RB]EIV13652.1 multidrug resistance ABC transporter ATP-binding and permease protei